MQDAEPDAVAEKRCERAALQLETTVDRTEFGLTWNAPLPAGGNALDNDVTLTIELNLIKED